MTTALVITQLILNASGTMSNLFKMETIETSWTVRKGQNIGKQGKMRCAQQCTIAKDTCLAIHHTSHHECFLVQKTDNLNEHVRLENITFWIKKDTNISRCIPDVYPHRLGKSRYRVEGRAKKNWTDAAKHCESLGGKLAQISSIAERNAVSKMLEGSSYSNILFFTVCTKLTSGGSGTGLKKKAIQ